MANHHGHISNQIIAQRVYRWVGALAALVFIFSAVWTAPAGAASGENTALVLAPQTTQPSLNLRAYNLPVPRSLQAPVAQPPLPNLGGDCISGYLIDSYHKLLGPGWEVTITPQQGPSQTTTTDANGKFIFSTLPAGTYTVELKVADGWRPFTPVSFPVTLSGVPGTCADVRFKLEALPCIKVIKLDAEGEVNGQLAGIPGWNFTAKSGSATFRAVTDGQGVAYFYNLVPGKWTVTEEDKVGWQPAKWYSNAMDLDLYPPEQPGACQVALFVNQQVHDACVIVTKKDVAGNPVPGWNVDLTRDDGTQPPAAGVTDASGQLTFTGLALGNWTVTEEVREWWRPISETKANVVLDKPGYCAVVDFINEPLGCVDGYKINHLDQPLAGWKINARNSDTGQEFATVTDVNGYFYFNQLSLGDWVISEELQPGWEPVTVPEFTVPVTQPFVCETVRFKNRTQYACVDVFKKDQIDGVGLPGWSITVQPAYGGAPVTGTTDGTGWVRFNGLTPGTYVIKEGVLPGWTPTTPDALTVDLAATGSCSVINFTNIQTHMIPQEPFYPEEDHHHDGHHKDKPKACHCPMYYTVKHGDTLWSISQTFDVPVNAIVKVNHIPHPSLIYPGTRYCIPLGDP
jgi:serine-aspartate repeat-containing protein C/D/E